MAFRKNLTQNSMSLPVSLQLHHIGCLTENISESLENYITILGFKKASDIITIESQQVKVCFVEISPGIFIELVEPQGENAALRKIIKSKNPYYHTGYMVNQISGVIEQLVKEGFYLVNRFASEAFDGRECAFLYTKELHLIELIENIYAV
jgi:methylmalonyl-CoA/ethylmalonyl-CoA epimerase